MSLIRLRDFGPVRWIALVVLVVALASPVVVHVWISIPLLLVAIFLLAFDNHRRRNAST